MSKTVMGGSEFFDGQRVDIHEGRFTGGFLLEEEDGVEIANGDQVTFIVTARTSTPKFTTTAKSGDLKRQNSFKVEAAFVIDPDQARYLYDNIGASVVGVNDGLIESKLAEGLLDELETLSAGEVPEMAELGSNGHIGASQSNVMGGVQLMPGFEDLPMFDDAHRPTFKVEI